MYPSLVENVRQLMADYMIMTATSLKIGHKGRNAKYQIELEPNLQTTSLIPNIWITFDDTVRMFEMTTTALDIIKDLAETVLADYTDFQTQIDLNEVEGTLGIRFLSYNIRKG